MNKQDRLKNIFSDPLFSELSKLKKATQKEKVSLNPEIERFNEIIGWMDENGGKEPEYSNDVFERKFYVRLNKYRENKKYLKILEEYDKYDILSKETTRKKVKSFNLNLKEALEQGIFTDKQFEKYSELTDTSRYKNVIKNRDKYYTRKKAENFGKYDRMFRVVKEEISNGTRKIMKVDSERNINSQKFYYDNGILVYVKSISEYFIDKNGYKNANLHLIYDNGTENNGILLRSFASNLFDKKRNGRMVSEIISDVMGETSIEERSNDNLTGYIYVLKSLSNNPEISEIKNLYKIGLARKDVEKRISNASNEATYLFAPVKIIYKVKVFNFNASKFEEVLHRKLEQNRLLIDIPTINGRIINPKEWYVIDIDEIIETINEITSQLII